MVVDLQKAGIWKRIAAWLLDIILLAVLAVGFATVLSALFGYDDYHNTWVDAYSRYETEYGVDFQEQSTDPEVQALQEQAYQALISDKKAMQAYNMDLSLSVLIITFGVLLATVALEFVVPLVLKNGQTVGKKCFAIGLMRTDGVKINHLQLFARAILGKYAIETMIPVYIVMMVLWNAMGIMGVILAAALLIAQLVCLAVTRTNSAIHDLLAGTVVVDLASQQIFGSTEELIEYTKRIHAEKAAKKEW